MKSFQDRLSTSNSFFLLAGPCAIEGEEMAMRIAEHMVKITEQLGIPFVFKGSFKKANRSRLDSFIGIGDEKALKILQKAANAKGKNLKVDGGLGPKTIGAMEGVELDRVRAYRVKYYADLVTRKPDLEKFYFGWFRRALEV